MAQTNGWGQAHINNTISFGGDVACGGGASFDADYQAVLDYATTQGYSLPSAGQQTLQNTLVTDLKTAGVWSKLDAFSVFATDGDADFALIDWVRLTTQTAVSSPTFTANQGYKGDGTSAYIDTLFNPSIDGVNYTLNSACFGYLTLETITATTTRIGARNGFGNKMSYDFTDNKPRINTNTSPTINTNGNAGNYLYNRDSSSQVSIYQDGSLAGSAADTATGLTEYNFYALALNNAGSAAIFSTNTLQVIFMGSELSAEASDFNTAVSTYLAAI